LKILGDRTIKAGHSRDEEKRYIQNYVIKTPSAPVKLHRFRETTKEKWINKNFIV
jgi:hypothetical protein